MDRIINQMKDSQSETIADEQKTEAIAKTRIPKTVAFSDKMTW